MLVLLKGGISLNNVIYRFGLDVQEIGSQVYLTIKQGDTARQLRIYLTEGYEPYTIDEDVMPVLAASKPDGMELFNDCVIEANEIIYDFTEQTVAAVGKVRCELRLYKDGEVLVSPNFTIEVQEGALGEGRVESLPEVTTLTGLVSEASNLIDEVNADLENGAFVPALTIGRVETLPTGANATASISGTGREPVLNLGLPAGPVGSAEGMVFDAELSPNSTNPVQNKVLYAAFDAVMEEVQEVDTALSASLEDKVDKVTGKGLSTNDYTTAEKSKLAGIAAGANNFVLEDGAVTAAKIAAGAVSESVSVTLTAAGWANNAQTVNVTGVTASNAVIVTPAPSTYTEYVDNGVRCTAQGAGTLTFACESAPSGNVTANVLIISK